MLTAPTCHHGNQTVNRGLASSWRGLTQRPGLEQRARSWEGPGQTWAWQTRVLRGRGRQRQESTPSGGSLKSQPSLGPGSSRGRSRIERSAPGWKEACLSFLKGFHRLPRLLGIWVLLCFFLLVVKNSGIGTTELKF